MAVIPSNPPLHESFVNIKVTSDEAEYVRIDGFIIGRRAIARGFHPELQEQLDNFKYFKIKDIDRPEKWDERVQKYKAILEARDVPAKFVKRRTEALRSRLEKLRNELIEPYFNSRATELSPEAARNAFNIMVDTVDTFQGSPLAKVLLLSGLKTDREVVLIGGRNTTAFTMRNSAGFMRAEYRNAFSKKHKYPDNCLYIAAIGTSEDIIDALLEETGHAAIFDMYRNNNAEPYMNADDPRKALLKDAIAKDLQKSPQMFPYLLDCPLDPTFYKETEYGAELPVKILKRMAMGKWDAQWREDFPNLTRFVEEVMLLDFMDYAERGEVSSTPAIARKKWVGLARDPNAPSTSTTGLDR